MSESAGALAKPAEKPGLTPLSDSVNGSGVRVILLLAGIAVLAVSPMLSGCGAAPLGNSSSTDNLVTSDKVPVKASRVEIDAGIVFVDESSYLCLPLEKLGLSPADEVASVVTSCDCATPSIVEFRDGSDRFSKALRLDFKADPTAIVEHLPARVGVTVRIILSSDQSCLVTVNLVHTQLRKVVQSG